jgi:hypothetical protein
MSQTYRANHNVSFGASRVPSHVKAGDIFELDDEHEEIAEKLVESGAISLVDDVADEASAGTGDASEAVHEEEDETKAPVERHNKARGAAGHKRR